MKKNLAKFKALVEALEELPTIGKKSATRLAYHMVMSDSFGAMKIAHAIESALGSLRRCSSCGGISEDELCDICSDMGRDHGLLCIVQSAKDILTIEENGLFDGRYFVLDSLETLDIEHLRSMVESGISEVVFALSPSISSDALILYVENKLEHCDVHFTRIAQGVPTGVSLENVDVISLTRALSDRVKI